MGRIKRFNILPSRLRTDDISEAEDFMYSAASSRDESLLRSPYDKQGHYFCGCCCDTRRAAIIINTLNCILSVLGVILVVLVSFGILSPYLYVQNLKEEFDGWDDDEVLSDIEMIFGPYDWVVQILLGISALMSLLGVYGAVYYSRPCVLTTTAWYISLGIASLFVLGWGGIGVFMAGFSAYPNLMFYQESVEGIMTPKTYPVERYSCCCIGAPEKSQPVTVQEAIEKRMGVFS